MVSIFLIRASQNLTPHQSQESLHIEKRIQKRELIHSKVVNPSKLVVGSKPFEASDGSYIDCS